MSLRVSEIPENILDEIKIFCKHKTNEESCGLIVLEDKKIIFKPCKNISPNPRFSFLISPKKIIEYDPICIVHSHLNSSAYPSEKDRISSDELCIPFLIYSLRDNVFFLYNNIGV